MTNNIVLPPTAAHTPAPVAAAAHAVAANHCRSRASLPALPTLVSPNPAAATDTLAQTASLPEYAQINLLHQRFREYGANAKLWSRQCQLLLPEIQRRQVWRRKGFASIYDYAAQLAGMSYWAVDDALRVLSHVADKPKLMALAVEKGLSRVRPIATIATKETETFWVEKAQTMSKHALEKYVSDYRLENGPGTTDEPVTVRVFVPLYPDVAKRLAALRDNLPTGELNKRVAEFLDRAEQDEEVRGGRSDMGDRRSVAEKEDEGETMAGAMVKDKPEAGGKKEARQTSKAPMSVMGPSRYIPAAIRHYVINKYRGRCAYPTCTRPYKILHHTQRFSLEPMHDPARIVPLCQAHEHLAHQGLIAREHDVPAKWRVSPKANTLTPDFDVDIQVRQRRRARR